MATGVCANINDNLTDSKKEEEGKVCTKKKKKNDNETIIKTLQIHHTRWVCSYRQLVRGKILLSPVPQVQFEL